MDLRVARPHALVALALLLGAPAAAADVVTLPDTRATFALDLATWSALPIEPAAAAAGLVAAYRSPSATLAIARARVPNPDAWRAKTRTGYVAQIERGIAASIPGYTRTARAIGALGGELDGVPMLDLEATGAAGTRYVIRVLLFRTYALTLAAEVTHRDLDRARAAVRSFGAR